MATTVREADAGRLLQLAGSHLCGKLREAIAARGRANLAVPGGRSVVEIFRAMQAQPLDWRRVQCFVVDERLVPPDHPDSNFRLLREHLVEPLTLAGRLPPENVHPFTLAPALTDRGVRRYEQVLAEHGSRFDVVLLSAGEDGHVAALFPGHHSIADRHHGFIVMEDSPKPPPGRMSSSRSLLQGAAAALLLFVGEGKRGAFGRFNDAMCPVGDCPAKLVHAIADATVFTDLPERPAFPGPGAGGGERGGKRGGDHETM